jgi:hypothetical protein
MRLGGESLSWCQPSHTFRPRKSYSPQTFLTSLVSFAKVEDVLMDQTASHNYLRCLMTIFFVSKSRKRCKKRGLVGHNGRKYGGTHLQAENWSHLFCKIKNKKELTSQSLSSSSCCSSVAPLHWHFSDEWIFFTTGLLRCSLCTISNRFCNSQNRKQLSTTFSNVPLRADTEFYPFKYRCTIQRTFSP